MTNGGVPYPPPACRKEERTIPRKEPARNARYPYGNGKKQKNYN